MAGNPLQLHHDKPQKLGFFRNLQLHHLLHRIDKHIVVGHGRYIIQAVRIRNDLRIVQVFRQLLGSPVEIAHNGNRLGDHLSIQLDNHPENPVGGRMLRAYIQEQFFSSQCHLCHTSGSNGS
ncbi:hypothetical protein D3C76_1613080 [compost metagenome]